jgi:hypothetical protein
VVDRASKTLPFLYQFSFLAVVKFRTDGHHEWRRTSSVVPTFSPADAEKGRGRRSAASQPENHTSLQIFKEHVLTDIGGAAKSVSSIYRFYRFLPVSAFSSEVRPLGDDQTGPNRTKDDRNFKFSTGCPPETFTKPLPFLYPNSIQVSAVW